MKKLVGLAMGAAVLYRVAKRNGIESLKELKTLILSELKMLTSDVKHELVS